MRPLECFSTPSVRLVRDLPDCMIGLCYLRLTRWFNSPLVMDSSPVIVKSNALHQCFSEPACMVLDFSC
jgi:hypothetical protein